MTRLPVVICSNFCLILTRIQVSLGKEMKHFKVCLLSLRAVRSCSTSTVFTNLPHLKRWSYTNNGLIYTLANSGRFPVAVLQFHRKDGTESRNYAMQVSVFPNHVQSLQLQPSSPQHRIPGEITCAVSIVSVAQKLTTISCYNISSTARRRRLSITM